MTVSVLLPSRNRENQLARVVDELIPDIYEHKAELIIVLPLDHKFDMDFPYTFTVITTSTRGYWRCLNDAFEFMRYERFVWLADDIAPRRGWLNSALKDFDRFYPDDRGLVSFNDLNILDAGAPFALTTREWLWVLFGYSFFPTQFRHGYLDTLVSDRSKDLGRYKFCKNAMVEHRHWSRGHAPQDQTYKDNQIFTRGDKARKDTMDNEWVEYEREHARKRLESDYGCRRLSA